MIFGVCAPLFLEIFIFSQIIMSTEMNHRQGNLYPHDVQNMFKIIVFALMVVGRICSNYTFPIAIQCLHTREASSPNGFFSDHGDQLAEYLGCLCKHCSPYVYLGCLVLDTWHWVVAATGPFVFHDTWSAAGHRSAAQFLYRPWSKLWRSSGRPRAVVSIVFDYVRGPRSFDNWSRLQRPLTTRQA